MQRKAELRHSKRRTLGSIVLAAFGAFVLMGTFATTARADSNFERGFEDQMGRILAYEAVNLGKQVLFQGVYRPTYDHGTPYGGEVYGRYDRGHGPAHNHWRPSDRRPRVVHHTVVHHPGHHRQHRHAWKYRDRHHRDCDYRRHRHH